jgi:hypothetical protein
MARYNAQNHRSVREGQVMNAIKADLREFGRSLKRWIVLTMLAMTVIDLLIVWLSGVLK